MANIRRNNRCMYGCGKLVYVLREICRNSAPGNSRVRLWRRDCMTVFRVWHRKACQRAGEGHFFRRTGQRALAKAARTTSFGLRVVGSYRHRVRWYCDTRTEGATGPYPTNRKGFQFNGAAGGNGFADNVTDVRTMGPMSTRKRTPRRRAISLGNNRDLAAAGTPPLFSRGTPGAAAGHAGCTSMRRPRARRYANALAPP